MSSTAARKNTVPAVERAIDILEYLIARNAATSIKELSEALALPKVSVFRLVKSLEAKGYVLNQGGQGRYILGAKIVSIGSRISKDANLSQVANPFMFQLARQTGQTVQLGVLFEYQVMYVDQIRTSEALTLVVPSRTPFAVNTSAGGKVLVASLDDERLQDFLQNTVLEANTPRAIVDKGQFRLELMRVRSQGYAIDDEEFARGVRCVAAPVLNSAGQTIASLGITGHTSEITDERLPGLRDATLRAAARISRSLGYLQGPGPQEPAALANQSS
ncbi:MAG: IclR family transcriptional regulator [Spirochaetales bacterium]|nr:IclR family transcriptional regulator [Spirochaetales bacterium]